MTSSIDVVCGIDTCSTTLLSKLNDASSASECLSSTTIGFVLGLTSGYWSYTLSEKLHLGLLEVCLGIFQFRQGDSKRNGPNTSDLYMRHNLGPVRPPKGARQPNGPDRPLREAQPRSCKTSEGGTTTELSGETSMRGTTSVR
ncbi:hypothetical protein LIER_01132 [Lithospermum erythrorhizon]|uniref:Uncharacterized protein n=1 Tax=Lithospermum erythrorhizon TaxID=34254 RepID=A0AAV3NKC7_LITER